MRIAIIAYLLLIAALLSACDMCGSAACIAERTKADAAKHVQAVELLREQTKAKLALSEAEAGSTSRASAFTGYGGYGAREYDALHERIGKRRSGSCGTKVARMKACLKAAGVLDQCQRDGCKVKCSTSVRAVARRCAAKVGGTW